MATEGSEEDSSRKSPAKKATRSSSGGRSQGSARERRPAKKSGGDDQGSSAKRGSTSTAAPRAASGRKRSGLVIATEAAVQLEELTARQVEGVTAVKRTDDGWRVEVEVLEVRRIPNTTDVLATYELTLDGDGDIEGYRRLRRYRRGTAGEEHGS